MLYRNFLRSVVLLLPLFACLTEPGTAQEPTTLRVMSFNIRHGEGVDRRIDLDRIAAVIEKEKPDLVALQEVDRNVKRSKNVDQARYLAEKLKMKYVFDKTRNYEGGEFGNAILSRFPILRNTSLRLPMGESGERSVLVTEIKVGKKKEAVIRFACTILGHRGGDRERGPQAEKMNLFFFIEGETSPVILAGDFFTGRQTKPIDEMRTKWNEVGDAAPEESEIMNNSRQDYIFFRSNDPFQVKEARVLNEPLLQQNPLFAVLARAEEVKIGDVLVKQSFGDKKLPEGWHVSDPKAVTVSGDSLQMELPSTGGVSVTKKLDVKPLLGTRLKITARIKADNVTEPPNSWNGIKAMLILDTPDGKRWLQRSGVWGSFDWKDVSFVTGVPENATAASFQLGLENTSGKVQFQDLKIEVIGKKPPKPSAEEIAKRPPVYTGHKVPRLRGAMISPGRFGPEDIKVLGGDWKANHIRWQLCWAGFPNGPADTATVEEFYDWIEAQCKLLDAMLPECEKYGVYVCLDLHTPPGGRMPRKEGSTMRLFHEKKFQDAFVAVWQRMAKRYKDQKMIWSYDLLNEPVEGDMPKDLLDWRELALKTAKEIRKIDPETAIVIEGAPWGGPEALEWFEPFDPKEVPNVVYSAHMYIPHNFTHQGVYESKDVLTYPGEIGGKHWDKAALRQALNVPIEFARDYGVHMYIGEFSAIRWAPDGSAYRYLKDCIEIFEEENWDWAYHAFREWDGWSVEHGPDKNDNNRTVEPTDRQLLLRSWFEKNRR